jgi:ABC-type spermidine/putrescine transport system permease subunit II
VLASHIAFCIPIVVIVVLPQLYEMNDSMLNAARETTDDRWHNIRYNHTT